MKKTIISCAVILALVLTYFCLPKNNTKEKESFEQYREDFVLITEYITSELNCNENATISIVWDEETHCFLLLYHNGDIYVPEDIMLAFDRTNEIFHTDFSFIEVTSERISFGGLGGEMYVLSLNKKAPDYFYHENDGMKMSVYYLGDGWYCLKSNHR